MVQTISEKLQESSWRQRSGTDTLVVLDVFAEDCGDNEDAIILDTCSSVSDDLPDLLDSACADEMPMGEATSETSEDVCAICLEHVEKNPMLRPMDKPNIACEIVFEKPNGESCIVAFSHRPLGMVATKGKTPVTVASIMMGSAAHQLGVGTGWIIRGIAGVEVKGFSYKEVFDLLGLSCETLPMETTHCSACGAGFHCGCLQNWVVKGKDNCPMCRQDSLPLQLMTGPPQEQTVVPRSPTTRFSEQVSTFLRGCIRSNLIREMT
jgi:hypothetical protein